MSNTKRLVQIRRHRKVNLPVGLRRKLTNAGAWVLVAGMFFGLVMLAAYAY